MDRLSKSTRSALMSQIRSRGNKATETRVRLALVRSGIKGWSVQPKGIIGNPDFAFIDSRIAVFVDSCFWHGCTKHRRMPHSNRNYWTEKIKGNRARDRRTNTALKSAGWAVLRIWEHNFHQLDKTIATLRTTIAPSTQSKGGRPR